MVIRILALGGALLSGVLAANDTTSCWKATSGATTAYTGSACAVDVKIPLVATSYKPNQNIALLWSVQFNAKSTNDMGVPFPLSSTDASMQILSTLVRTCPSRKQCSPLSWDNTRYTTPQFGDLSNSGPTTFSTTGNLSFAKEGNYTVAALAVLGNADKTVLYYFQTYADLVVKNEQVMTKRDSTYSRVSLQSPFDAQLDPDKLLVTSKSTTLELKIEVDDFVQPNQPFDIMWTAILTRNSSKHIQLPTPLQSVWVERSSTYYTIVNSVVKLCNSQFEQCNEYSRVATVASAEYAANFTSADTATFNTNLVVPSTGQYSGFAQLTLAGASDNSERFDFIKYFNVLAPDENVTHKVENETYIDDGKESYCWDVVAAASDKNVTTNRVISSRNSSICPYTINLNISARTFSAGSDTVVSWSIQPNYTDEVGVIPFLNKSNGHYFDLPQVEIYYCSNTKCSPFTTKKTLVYFTQANLSETTGQATFSTNLSLPTAGPYTIMAHAVVPTENTTRLDVASFMHVTVTESSASETADNMSDSNTLILALFLGIVLVICIILLVLDNVRRRRAKKENTQENNDVRISSIVFRPISATNPLAAQSPPSVLRSQESGRFKSSKPTESPMDRASSLAYPETTV